MTLEKTSPKEKERNYGIDLLRIVAMFMVVLLHVLGPGGILFEVKAGTMHFAAAWLLEMAVFCAINCYGIISGYVGVTSRYKYSNYSVIWLQVALYSVLISLFFYLRYPTVLPFSTVTESFFPVCNEYYWYFTAYTGMFLLMPLLNKSARELTKDQLKAVIIALFVALCVLPCFVNEDIFLSGWGYSALWLCFLYITGAYIRQHGFFKNSTRLALALYVICVLISWGVKMWEEFVAPSAYWADLAGGLLTQYSSPTMFLSGVCLFVIFANIKPPKALHKIIAFIAPCTFGVYIIHAHPLMWERLITYKYAHLVNESIPVMLGGAILGALCLFAALWVVDFVRLQIFRLLRIKPLMQKLEAKIVGDLWD